MLGIQTTDEAALKAFYVSLYEKYGVILRRRCERVLRNQADAEDVVHGLFVDLIQKRKRNIDFSYLFRAATNRCITQITTTKRRGVIMEQEIPRDAIPYHVDDKVIDQELFSLLVKRLNRKACEVLVYRFVDNMNQTEMAAMMGVSRRTVSNYLKRIEKAVGKVKNVPRDRRSLGAQGVEQ